MVHKFYFYDSRVGTAITLEFEYSFDDAKLFDSALSDFKNVFLLVLDCKYLFLTPSNAFEESEGFSNVVIDGDDYLIACVADLAIAFFKVRGFVLR